jgi:hypothetical protein
VAFDDTGALLWSTSLEAGASITSDLEGNLFTLFPDARTSPRGPGRPDVVTGLVVERLDASGAPLSTSGSARVSVPVATTEYGRLLWSSGPTAGGLVLALQWLGLDDEDHYSCLGRASIFHVESATLSFEPLGLGSP